MLKITALENVQRRMTRAVPGLKEFPYEVRLKKLNLPTLSYRRLRGDMIQVYKIITEKQDSAVTENLYTYATDNRTRGHRHKLQKTRFNTTKCKNSFFFRITDTWNNLPDEVVSAPTVLSFEHKLDNHWKNHPMYFDYRACQPYARPGIRGF